MTPEEVAEEFGQALMQALERVGASGQGDAQTLLSLALAVQSELDPLVRSEATAKPAAALVCKLGEFALRAHEAGIQSAEARRQQFLADIAKRPE